MFHNAIQRMRWTLPVLIIATLVLASLPVGFSTSVAQAQGIAGQPCTLLYAVQQGDTLTNLGRRFSTTVNNIYGLNPVLRNQSNIFPGLVLCLSSDPNVILPGSPGLPPTGATPGINVVRVNPGQNVTLAGTGFVANTAYVIQMYRFGAANPAIFRVADFNSPTGGDFVQTIAIPPQLSNAERIQVRVLTANGQTVASTAFVNRVNSGQPAENCTQYYTVRSGDTLSSISRRFNVSVQRLVLLNNLVNVSLIFTGQRLCIEAGQPNNPPSGAQPSLQVMDVDADVDVTVGGMYFPTGVQIQVDMGVANQSGGNPASFTNVGSFMLDRGDDGHFLKTFRIPQAFRGQPNLAIRMTRTDTNRSITAGFSNVRTSGSVEPDSFPLTGGTTLPDFSALFGAVAGLPSAKLPGDLTGAVPVQRGRTVNLNQGSAGVYIDRAAYDNTLLVAQPIDPHLIPVEGLIFTQPLLLVGMTDTNGALVQEINGSMYVYFDVTNETRQQYDISQLDIYFYSLPDNAWMPCDSQIPVNEEGPELDRLACQLDSFGLYGLAIRP